MASKPKPCQVEGCERPKWKPRHRCYWHGLLALPIEEQIDYAAERLEAAETPHKPRVAPADWPDGERWCSGCQSFVPLFYAQGSRCKACNSRAAYDSHLRTTYNITYGDYRAMWLWQKGRCYICLRKTKKRLAVDHNHKTGEVRGLLCADSERGCNHALLGNITGVEMAKRIVAYLEDPPLRALRAGHPLPEPIAEEVERRRSRPLASPEMIARVKAEVTEKGGWFKIDGNWVWMPGAGETEDETPERAADTADDIWDALDW